MAVGAGRFSVSKVTLTSDPRGAGHVGQGNTRDGHVTQLSGGGRGSGVWNGVGAVTGLEVVRGICVVKGGHPLLITLERRSLYVIEHFILCSGGKALFYHRELSVVCFICLYWHDCV